VVNSICSKIKDITASSATTRGVPSGNPNKR
jgi:hypothetical protein